MIDDGHDDDNNNEATQPRDGTLAAYLAYEYESSTRRTRYMQEKLHNAPVFSSRTGVRFFEYADLAAFRRVEDEVHSRRSARAGDVVYVHKGPSQHVFVCWHLHGDRDTLTISFTEELGIDARDEPDDVDVELRYAPILRGESRCRKPIDLYLRPTNVAVTRLYGALPHDVLATLRRFYVFKLCYRFGSFTHFKTRLWRLAPNEVNDLPLKSHSDCVSRFSPRISRFDALLDCAERFRRMSVPLSTLHVLLVTNKPRLRFLHNNLALLLGITSWVPGYWHIANSVLWFPTMRAHPGMPNTGSYRYMLELRGPVETRAEVARLLTLVALRERKPPVVVELHLIDLKLPRDWCIDLAGWRTQMNGHVSEITDWPPLVVPSPASAQPHRELIVGAQFRWSYQHARMLDVVLALASLELPVYVKLWILEWLPEPFIWRSTELQRVRLLEGVHNSVKRLRAQQAAAPQKRRQTRATKTSQTK